MSTIKGIKKPLAAAVAVAALGVLSGTAAADVSGSLNVASQDLWRGMTINSGTYLSGNLDYNHSSGLYAGLGVSNGMRSILAVGGPAALGGDEYDVYVGFKNEVSGLSYDIGYITHNFSGDLAAVVDYQANDMDYQEAHVGLGYAGINFDAFLGVGKYGQDSAKLDNKDNYYDLSYTYQKFTGLVGYSVFDKNSPAYFADNNFTHVELTYAVTPQLHFTLSQIVNQKAKVGDSNYNPDDQLRAVVSYSFKI